MLKKLKLKVDLERFSSQPARNCAVSLGYDELCDRAPYVAGCGKGHAADVMKKIAQRYGIKTHEDRILANKLESVDVQEEVPEAFYEDIADVFIKYGL